MDTVDILVNDDADKEQESVVGDAEGNGEEPMVRKAVTPDEPAPHDRENHRLSGHAVFRSWCKYCQMGRGRADAHRTTSGERGAPVLGWDYFYMGQCTAFMYG